MGHPVYPEKASRLARRLHALWPAGRHSLALLLRLSRPTEAVASLRAEENLTMSPAASAAFVKDREAALTRPGGPYGGNPMTRGILAIVALVVLAAGPARAGKKQKQPPALPVCITANIPTQTGGFVDPNVKGPYEMDLGNVRLFLGYLYRPMVKLVDEGCQVSVVVEARGERVVEAPATVVVEGAERKFTVKTVNLTVTPAGGEPIPVWGHALDLTLACAKPLATEAGGFKCGETGYWQAAAKGASDYVGSWIMENHAALMKGVK